MTKSRNEIEVYINKCDVHRAGRTRYNYFVAAGYRTETGGYVDIEGGADFTDPVWAERYARFLCESFGLPAGAVRHTEVVGGEFIDTEAFFKE